MSTSIVLTIISDDRTGIIETLSETLVNHQGNWVESSMLSLAGKFAGILRANVPNTHAQALINELQALQSTGLQIVVQASNPAASPDVAQEFSLELVGQDRPGIVRDISRVLSRYKVNVEELDTECQSASMSGEDLFLGTARIRIPKGVSLEALQLDLEELANELMVDLKLEN